MASNPATPFGVEFGDRDDLHGVASERLGAAASGAPRSGFSPANSAVGAAHGPDATPPFAALTARNGRPLRVAILSDFTRITYANGAAFQTRFLYQELRRCGHQVTVIGPRDPHSRPQDLAPGTVELPSLPLRNYPGVYLPIPSERWIADTSLWNFDIIYAQTTSLLLQFGVWLRKMKGIPLVSVNTTHLIAAYEALLPESLSKNELLQAGLHMTFRRPTQRLYAGMYNESDGLVVLSEGLRSYWRECGVTAPIHVIPRAVQPEIFDRPIGPDPYASFAGDFDGPRLLCAGRHTREKCQDRVIRIFARHIAPKDASITLTVLGEGPDADYYKRVAREEGVAHRVFFPGEVPFTQMADFYAHADVFVHASLSETYGNVMGEALWCGTPTVAYADGMGVSAQIKDGVNGVLLAPGKGDRTEREADAAFARAVLELVNDPRERARLGRAASKMARERCSPFAVQAKLASAFAHAQDHAAASGLRPAIERPKPLQWLTTFHHFRQWSFYTAGLSLAGRVRPASDSMRERVKGPKLHPQFDR